MNIKSKHFSLAILVVLMGFSGCKNDNSKDTGLLLVVAALMAQTGADTTAPTEVNGLQANAAGSNQIQLSWTAATDDKTVQSNIVYEICQSLLSGGCDSFSVSHTTTTGAVVFDVMGLNPITTYFFRVRAKDAAGNSGSASTEATATTDPAGTVNTPTYSPVAGTYDNAQDVVISTTTVGATICYTTDGDPPVCGSEGTCATGAAYSAPIVISDTKTLKAIGCLSGYTDSSVATVDYIINDTTAPSEVIDLTATAGSGEVILNWTDPSDGDLDHVEITWSPDGATVQTVLPGVGTYTATGLSNGTLYTFTVKTVDSTNNTSTGTVTTETPNHMPGDQDDLSTNGIALKMRFVPGKSFKTGIYDDGTASVDTAYWVAETEVTYELWYTVKIWAESNGYTFANAGREGDDGTDGAAPTADNQEPVTGMNWRDAMIWLNALTEWHNAQHGTNLEVVYTSDAGYTIPIRTSTNSTTITWDAGSTYSGTEDEPFVNPSAKGFRLPTANEWELAARYIADKNGDGDIEDGGEYYPGNYASGATDFFMNEAATSAVAWYMNNSGYSTHVVATKTANALGLYDMCGNVLEWNFDWFPSFVGTARAGRGGSWYTSVTIGLSAASLPYFTSDLMGFRAVRTE